MASEGHHRWTAYDGVDEVGMVRVHIERKSGICRERPVVSIGLAVFGDNLGARARYEQMGFEVRPAGG